MLDNTSIYRGYALLSQYEGPFPPQEDAVALNEEIPRLNYEEPFVPQEDAVALNEEIARLKEENAHLIERLQEQEQQELPLALTHTITPLASSAFIEIMKGALLFIAHSHPSLLPLLQESIEEGILDIALFEQKVTAYCEKEREAFSFHSLDSDKDVDSPETTDKEALTTIITLLHSRPDKDQLKIPLDLTRIKEEKTLAPSLLLTTGQLINSMSASLSLPSLKKVYTLYGTAVRISTTVGMGVAIIHHPWTALFSILLNLTLPK